MRRTVIVLATSLALVPCAAVAGVKSSSIVAELGREGPAATVKSLRAKHKWERVLDHIGTGKPAWLAVAPGLAAGTDASASLGLTIALADALPHNPTAVLELVRDATGPLALNQVCSAPYIKPSQADLASYRRAAKHAVDAVTVPDLRSARSACLKALKGPGVAHPA